MTNKPAYILDRPDYEYLESYFKAHAIDKYNIAYAQLNQILEDGFIVRLVC